MIETIEKKKLWILEDDQMVNWVYNEILSPKFDIVFFTAIHDFQMALETLPKPQMIISDLRLTDGNFIDFLKNNFSKMEGTPYLVVSTDANEESLQFCLKEGAVDYLTKPFRPTELSVKIERFLQKHADVSLQKLKLLDENFMNNNLTSKESKILKTLAKNINNFVSRKDIIESVWNNDTSINPKTLDVHIYNLRRKICSVGLQIYSDSDSRLKLA